MSKHNHYYVADVVTPEETFEASGIYGCNTTALTDFDYQQIKRSILAFYFATKVTSITIRYTKLFMEGGGQ